MNLRAFIAGTILLAPALAAAEPQPIIDVHLHAEAVSEYGPPGQKFCMEMLKHVPPVDPQEGPIMAQLLSWQMDPGCADPMEPAASDDDLREKTLAVLKTHNITGIISGPPAVTAEWKAAAPENIIVGRQFNLQREADVTPESLAAAFKTGEFAVLAEVTNQYHGFGPNDPAFDPYWAVFEENDIPVGIHIGGMPPGAAYWGSGARVALGDAMLLEEILVRHPRLRVYIMHAGLPQFDRTIALMQQYPQVYAGTGVLQAVMTKEGYESFLERMIEAGLGKRLMYGTDQMIWPGMIERSLRRVEESKVLTKAQKRDILYNNAARFFRLEEAEGE